MQQSWSGWWLVFSMKWHLETTAPHFPVALATPTIQSMNLWDLYFGCMTIILQITNMLPCISLESLNRYQLKNFKLENFSFVSCNTHLVSHWSNHGRLPHDEWTYCFFVYFWDAMNQKSVVSYLFYWSERKIIISWFVLEIKFGWFGNLPSGRSHFHQSHLLSTPQ